MRRAVVSSVLTFALGVGGGVAANKVFPPHEPITLAAQPAEARPIPFNATAGEDGVADLVDKVKLSVVNIDIEAHRAAPQQVMDPFRFFQGEEGQGQPQMAPPEQVMKGVGSGFIVRQDGLIVTNNHVVHGADKLTVTLANGQKYTGKVIGQDPGTDLALIKIDAHSLPALQFADAAKLRVGQYVMAVGSPLGLSQTVTTGILSAINRDISLNARVGFLQTDAAINPGNSGGPLLNLKGQVIGMNTAIAARGQGIGFAIPVDTLSSIIPQLEAKGHVDRSWIGVSIGNLPDDRAKMFYPVDHGALVGGVAPNGPAAKAGLQGGDIITAIDGKAIDGAPGLIREVGKHDVGSIITVSVSRQGQQKDMKLNLDRMPDRMALGVPEQSQEGN
jgi:serine protease Do